MILLTRAAPWLATSQGRRVMRDAAIRVASEPLAALAARVLVIFGSMLWMLAVALSPGVEAGVCAAEGWLLMIISGPLLAAGELARRRAR